MNCKRLRIITGLIAVVLMIVIFLFSAQPGSASDKTSITLTSLLFSGEDFDFIMFLNVFVRKAAHMAEYAALAVPAWLFVSTFEIKKLWGNILPFVFAAFYAATDEFHQLFVPSRSGQVRDVLIDSVGALLGIVFINIVILIADRYGKKHPAKKE